MPLLNEPVPAINLRDLPRDDQGFPVPAEAPWSEDGKPRQSAVNPPMKLLLTAYRACPVCGYRLPTDEPVWRIHDEYSRKVTHEDMRGGEISALDVPGHLVCMLYSALVCPFWRSAGGRLGKDNAYQPNGKRGVEPSIMGFSDYAVVVDPSQPLATQSFMLLYRDFETEIAFNNPLTDLASQYEQERRRCGGRYVGKKRRHYAPQFGGQNRLLKELKAIADSFEQRQPDQITLLEGRRVGVFG